jgi:hypothetical protein
LLAALKRIYSEDFNPLTELEEHLFNEFWNKLNEATERGYAEVAAIDTDVEFIRELRHNNAVFSAFKVHRMQNDMAAKLIDENGDLKPFKQWLNDVQPVADHQCRRWFQTEYDTAVKRAHLAAEWRQFEREADVLPNLEWIKSTSITPGADHIVFWGTVRPINDAFWSSHKPGDRWGCKCSLRATDKEPTPDRNMPAPTEKDEPSAGLNTNPARDGKIFSDTHPYIANAYKGAKKAVKNFLDTEFPVVIKQYKNGGMVQQFKQVDTKASDYMKILAICKQMAKDGKQAVIYPRFSKTVGNPKYERLFASLKDTQYWGKCPDFNVDDAWWEHEGFDTAKDLSDPKKVKDTFLKMLSRGIKQSDRIVIEDCDIDRRWAYRNIWIRAHKENQNINEVYIRKANGELELLYKKKTD